MQKLIVEPKFNNKKLSNFLYSHFSGLTPSTFYKALRKKDIKINDIRIHEDQYIHEFDTITIFITDDLLYKKFDIKTIYEDENILIVYKPTHLEVTNETSSESLTKILSQYFPYIKPCHRLDRNTTGLILFAKNKETLNILLEKFKNQEIRKFYKCTVLRKNAPKRRTIKSISFQRQ